MGNESSKYKRTWTAVIWREMPNNGDAWSRTLSQYISYGPGRHVRRWNQSVRDPTVENGSEDRINADANNFQFEEMVDLEVTALLNIQMEVQDRGEERRREEVLSASWRLRGTKKGRASRQREARGKRQ